MNTINKAIAMAAKPGTIFFHHELRNVDGTAMRAKVIGKCQTWKTRPNSFRLSLKYGLSLFFAITETQANQWMLIDPTKLSKISDLQNSLGALLFGFRIPVEVLSSEGNILVPAYKKINRKMIDEIIKYRDGLEIAPCEMKDKILQVIVNWNHLNLLTNKNNNNTNIL